MPRPDAPDSITFTSRETREVTVQEPQLSPATNQRLTEELRQVVGSDRVDVAAARSRPSQGERPSRAARPGVRIPRSIALSLAAAAVIAIAVLAATSANWWVLAVAIAALAAVTYIVLASVLRLTSNRERPAATTVAAMEDEGITDAEGHFSDLVAEFTPEHGAHGQNRRTTSVEDNPAAAAAEHEHAITPSSGATQPVGPGAGRSQN